MGQAQRTRYRLSRHTMLPRSYPGALTPEKPAPRRCGHGLGGRGGGLCRDIRFRHGGEIEVCGAC